MINRLFNLISTINIKKKEKRFNYDLIKNKDFHLLFISSCST